MNVKKNININEWETMCEEEKKEGGGTRAKNIGCDKTQWMKRKGKSLCGGMP